jgi:hypothetical protein
MDPTNKYTMGEYTSPPSTLTQRTVLEEDVQDDTLNDGSDKHHFATIGDSTGRRGGFPSPTQST